VSAVATGELARRLRLALREPGSVIVEPEQLRPYSADTYWRALAAEAAGRPLGMPDVVALPGTEEQVAAVVKIAGELGVPIVARGGGSGSQGGAVPTSGGIVLDLTGLDQLTRLDERSMTVTAQAGVNGRWLEEYLNERGLMLPHYPASAAMATVGGYVAARGSGVLSTRYGKIEDLLVSLRVVGAEGTTFDTISVPRHAVGPELTQLYVGSEGTLGIILRATLQVVPLPEARLFRAVAFPSLPEAIDGIRTAIAAGLRPSVVRVYDERSTRESLGPVVGEELGGVCAMLCCEGRRALAEVEASELLAIAAEKGAREIDPAVAESWWNHRYDFYDPPHQPQLPDMWGTIEAVATYDRVLDVYAAMQAAIAERFAADGLVLKSHLSHWYPWGTMIYGRFAIPDPGPDPDRLHDEVWEAGVDAILSAGGLMNDHHGVGMKLAPYMARQHGLALEPLRKIKRALDPDGILNPGKLGIG
jgi:alkyldihydroxyacetonephosphate synthase